MNKLLKHPWAIFIVVLVLLCFTLLVSIHYYQEDEKKEIEKNPVVLPDVTEPVEPDLPYNESDVLNIVNNQKTALRNLFYNSTSYILTEVDSSRPESDNALYFVFDEQFLAKLRDLVSDGVYASIYNNFEYLKQDVNHTFYLVKRSYFDDIYLNSAIAEVNISDSSIHINSVTEEMIDTNISLTSCESENCLYANVSFVLIKVNNSWIISNFQ